MVGRGKAEDDKIIVELYDKYLAAMHAMQAGVAMMMETDSKQTDPKHMRVGINSALISNTAVVDLLVEKGVITQVEFFQSLLKHAEMERDSYQQQISEKLGTKVTLV